MPLQAFEENEGGNAAMLLAEQYLLPVETVLDDIPALALTEQEAHRLKAWSGHSGSARGAKVPPRIN